MRIHSLRLRLSVATLTSAQNSFTAAIGASDVRARVQATWRIAGLSTVHTHGSVAIHGYVFSAANTWARLRSVSPVLAKPWAMREKTVAYTLRLMPVASLISGSFARAFSTMYRSVC